MCLDLAHIEPSPKEPRFLARILTVDVFDERQILFLRAFALGRSNRLCCVSNEVKNSTKINACGLNVPTLLVFVANKGYEL